MKMERFELFPKRDWLFGVILVTLLIGALLSDSPSQAAELQAGSEGNWIPDGVWVGAFSGSDAISFTDTSAKATFTGTLNLKVVAGLVDGTFENSGFSSSKRPGTSASAKFKTSGVLTGTASNPVMNITSATYDFDVNSQGISTSFQLVEDSGFSPIDLTLVSLANCNQISGNFNASAVQSLESANAKVLNVQTEFTITRTSGIDSLDPGIYQTELAELLKETDLLISETVANEKLDSVKLFSMLSWASDLNGGVNTDNVCTTGAQTPNKFTTAIVGIVAKLIKLAGDHPEWFPSVQVNQLAYAAASVGAIGPGAPNEELAVDLALILENVADAKLAENETNPDCSNLSILYAAGKIIGAESMLIKISDAISQYQCGG